MLPPYTITRRRRASLCYATTIHHNKTTRGFNMLCYPVHHSKTTRGIILLCYHRTPQQDIKGVHHAMLPPYTTTRRHGVSSYYATIVHHSKMTRGFIMICYHSTPYQDGKGYHHAMLPPYTTTRRRSASL